MSLSTLLRGTTYEKLRWTFTLYDLNGDGFITKHEVHNVMVAVHELMGMHGSPVVGVITLQMAVLTFIFSLVTRVPLCAPVHQMVCSKYTLMQCILMQYILMRLRTY